METAITLTVTVQDIVLFVLGVLAAVLLVYLILLLRKVIETIKKLDLILDDSKGITEIANKRTKQVDEFVDGVGESVGAVFNSAKSKHSAGKAAAVVNSVSSVVGKVKDKKASKTSEDK